MKLCELKEKIDYLMSEKNCNSEIFFHIDKQLFYIDDIEIFSDAHFDNTILIIGDVEWNEKR